MLCRAAVIPRPHMVEVNGAGYEEVFWRPATGVQPGGAGGRTADYTGSDAEFNIGTAVGAVQSLPAGVYIAMNGRIWDPLKVRKNVAANRFEAAG